MANAPPSSYHLNESGMLTRSRQRNNSTLSQASTSTTAGTIATSDGSEQQYAPGASHLFDDSEPDSPLSSAYTASPVPNTSRLPNHGGGRHSRAGGRDSDASASGASSFGPERTSGASSPIASTSYHANSDGGGVGHPSNVNPATGKRKRSRVTPVQLTHLERVFAKDRSPTAAKRKDLAEVLGMNERQTQVWFQNRRAKAKLLEHRARSSGGGAGTRTPALRGDHYHSGPSNGGSYATSVNGVDADALGRIHEDEAVFIIPCSDLCIGTFRRVSAGLNDLIGYICEGKKILAWYVYSAGTGFKMEIAFDNISFAEMTEDPTQGQSRAIIHLTGHPFFYREFSTAAAFGAHLGPGGNRQWQRCDDWTENRQASSALIHQVVGRTTALERALAPFLPQELNDAEGEVDESQPLGNGTAATNPPMSSSSRRSSIASGPSVGTIQTPSLLSVLPSPAPPSAYRDPFGSLRSAQVRTYQSAPHSHHARKRSRSDASLPFGLHSQFDFDFDQNGRHSTGASLSHPHHPNPHSLASPTSIRTTGGRLGSGPFSAGPFGPSDGGTFAAQQEQSLAQATFPHFDHLLSYSTATTNSNGPAVSATTTSDDAFLVDAAAVPIARSYSSSNASSAGRPALYMGGVTGSRPGTAASAHSMSHSPFDAHSQGPMIPLVHPHPHSQLQQHSQEQNQQNPFDVGSMDVGLQHLGAGIDVGLEYESAMNIGNIGAMPDINLMFQPHSHPEYVSDDSIHQQPPHQQPAHSNFPSGTHSNAFLHAVHDIGPSAIPADVPLPSSPLGIGHDNLLPSTEFS